MMEDIIREREGFDDKYGSESEFKEQLKLQVDLSSKQLDYGWVFWRTPEIYEQLESLISSSTQIIKDKIQRLLEEFASNLWYNKRYVVQFWAAEAGKVYLTTSEQPFAVGRDLYKGLSWYRQRCMGHRYRVDEGAGENELGAVGRAYRNKRPESSPDLRLYSTNEFPLRDSAARCGLRSYYALPVFDLLDNKCYGVIEALCFQYGIYTMLSSLEKGLKAAELRTTHVDICTRRFVHVEIQKMVELAVEVMPQLRMAQVWVPCPQCSNTSNNFTCFQTAYHSSYGEEFGYEDEDISNYILACRLQNLQIAEDTNPIAQIVMSSNHTPCICRNICDLSLSENPLAHYAQKARFSFCFAICLQSTYNSRDIYLVEFYLQFNSGEDTVVGSLLKLLLSIMERELKSFDFAYKGQHGEELEVVEVTKENVLSSNKSSQSNAVRYKTLKYKHEEVEDVSMLMVMKGCEDEYAQSDFMKYLQKPGLDCRKPYVKRDASVFWVSSLKSDTIQKKIKCLMRKITSILYTFQNVLAQFWAAKKDDMGRCYLETSDQPFAVSSLRKGIASFRKQCMGHKYYVDDAAKGPPGRVFLNGHPEYSPDLLLYSTTEFPLRNHAAQSSLRKYYALPIFKTNQQHICLGVLEFLQFSNFHSGNKNIIDLLKAANLMTSTHVNFNPSARGVTDIAAKECLKLALTEMKVACELFTEIPQVYFAEVWVLNNECGTINTKLSCMKRVYTTLDDWYLDFEMDEFKHVESRKGITGMALASENNSCFCLNLCGFGLPERTGSHYAQAVGLDVCFAICLQSWHTGDLVYVLEFYLNQGPRRYDYFRSFLCLLLPLLKQKLTSFKVASGQQLGDKLIFEVIEFSQVNEFDVVELDYSDGVPITFKFVNYQTQKHSEEHKHDVQFCPADDGVESVSIVAEANHCNKSAANLKKKEAAKGTKEGKSETGLNITFLDLQSHFGKKRKDAAKELGVSESTFKRLCRKYGIQWWPQNEKYKKNPSLFMIDIADQSGWDSQPNMNGLPNSTNLPPPDMSQTEPKSSQHLITQPNVDMVVIYAKYESKTIKFKLCHTAGMEKLLSEVAMRLKMEVGSFEMEYLDEINEKILLTCDADLELCLEGVPAEGKCYIQISSLKNPTVMGKSCNQVVPFSSTPPSSFAAAYIHHFPSCFHSYILRVKNVVGDGHCGFRVVADLLGFGEESWGQVRRDLIDELRLNQQLYTSVFVENGAVEKILQILQCFDERASNAHWFTLPEMGYLVASTYNVALVSLSTNMCSTFLPLRTSVPCNLRCICIGLVNNDHFVQVFLCDGHPLPHVLAKWYECRYPDAASWHIVYTKQLMLYNSILGDNNVVHDTINLED